MISGFIVDPDRKKMSKSKGNVVVPTEILDKFGADAVRWRAAMARPGLDSPFDETQMKVGRRLAMKVLNASQVRPRQRRRDRPDPRRGHRAGRPARCWPRCAAWSTQATDAFEAYDYTTALEATEKFFWEFCDDYLELVKERAYADQGGAGSDSAQGRAARSRCSVQLRLLAPFLPYVTEEVWSWWQEGSVHRAAWPTTAELAAAAADPALLTAVAAALIGIRGAKSQAKVSMKTEPTRAVITGTEEVLGRLLAAEDDLRSVGRITSPIEWLPTSAPLEVTIDLKPAES